MKGRRGFFTGSTVSQEIKALWAANAIKFHLTARAIDNFVYMMKSSK